jgi:hypothetical protein
VSSRPLRTPLSAKRKPEYLVSHLIYVGGFSGGIDSQAAARFMLNRYGVACAVLVNADAGGNEHPLTVEHIDWYCPGLRIGVRSVRVSLRGNSLLFARHASVLQEHVERSTDGVWLLRVERVLKAAFETAQRVFRLRVFLADHIERQLVILDELHTRSLTRLRHEVSK